MFLEIRVFYRTGMITICLVVTNIKRYPPAKDKLAFTAVV